MLRPRPGRRGPVEQRGAEAGPLQRHLRHAGDRRRRRQPQQVQQGRGHVAGVGDLAAQLAPRGDPRRPADHQRIADAAAVGVLLVAPQRRIRRHRPAQREVGMGVRPADVVDAGDLLLHRLGLAVVGPHGVDHAQRPALLAGPVVRQHQDQGVLAQARLLKEADQPRQMLVGVIQHAGEGRLQPGEQPLLIGGMLVPGLHMVVARRHDRVRRYNAQRLLPRQPPLALDIPAGGEHRVVFLDDLPRNLVRRVTGPQRQPGQPGDFGRVGRMVGDIADRLVD